MTASMLKGQPTVLPCEQVSNKRAVSWLEVTKEVQMAKKKKTATNEGHTGGQDTQRSEFYLQTHLACTARRTQNKNTIARRNR